MENQQLVNNVRGLEDKTLASLIERIEDTAHDSKDLYFAIKGTADSLREMLLEQDDCNYGPERGGIILGLAGAVQQLAERVDGLADRQFFVWEKIKAGQNI